MSAIPARLRSYGAARFAVVISMILPEQLACFFAEAFRMRRKQFKKTSRVWFVSEE